MSSNKTLQKVYFEINKDYSNSQKLINNQANTITNIATSKGLAAINPSLYNYLSDLISSSYEVLEDYTNIQIDIMPIRGNIIDWLLVISDLITITQETFFKTITLFDKYISKLTNEEKEANKLHFIAVVCFFISYKFEETGVMTLEFVSEKLLRSKYTKKEILAQETQILCTLNFRLNFPTINTFSNIIIEAFKSYQAEQEQTINTYQLDQAYASKLKNFIPKLACIFNFVNKISLFVDEFIFGTKPFKLAIINLKTTFMLMKNLGILDNKTFNCDSLMNELAGDFLNEKQFKQIDIMAKGLYLAIMNQEKTGCHEKIFEDYYGGMELILKQEMVNCL